MGKGISRTKVIESIYPEGSGFNGSITITNANTTYPIPITAPIRKYILVLHNRSDTDIYVGYENSSNGGVRIIAGGTATILLGVKQRVYCYCESAGKVINYTYKEI